MNKTKHFEVESWLCVYWREESQCDWGCKISKCSHLFWLVAPLSALSSHVPLSTKLHTEQIYPPDHSIMCPLVTLRSVNANNNRKHRKKRKETREVCVLPYTHADNKWVSLMVWCESICYIWLNLISDLCSPCWEDLWAPPESLQSSSSALSARLWHASPAACTHAQTQTHSTRVFTHLFSRWDTRVTVSGVWALVVQVTLTVWLLPGLVPEKRACCWGSWSPAGGWGRR